MLEGLILEVSPKIGAEQISNFFSLEGPKVERGASKTETIAKILFGTKANRLGNMPNKDEVGYLSDLVSRYVNQKYPIEIMTLWGALKGYGQFDSRLEADIFDLVGIRRYAALNAAVSAVYSPGLKVTIIREDLEEISLCPHFNDLDFRMTEYRSSLDKLCRVLGFEFLHFTDMSAIFDKKGIPRSEYFTATEINKELLFNYWQASSNLNPFQWSQLPEQKKLAGAGWAGGLPKEARDYHIARVSSEHPSMDSQQKIEKVCTSLGVALTRKHFGVFAGSYEDNKGPIPPLRTSFMPFPPGTPSTLRNGRIEYKVKDDKRSNNTIPPWCGFGFIKISNGVYEPTIVGLRAYRTLNIQSSHPLIISNGYETQSLKADIL